MIRRGGCRRVAGRSGGTSPRATLTVVVIPGFSIDVLPRGYGAWIPAGAGMTNGGFVRELESRLGAFSYR